uniref:Ankyrin repeat protein n=1 Tax=viral metagenome TaxID=1070528 RepID=A0A6C0C8V5_9ZZZZ
MSEAAKVGNIELFEWMIQDGCSINGTAKI